MEYWHKNDYENGTYTYISDAKGVAIEGENEDEFFQIRQCSKINIDKLFGFCKKRIYNFNTQE